MSSSRYPVVRLGVTAGGEDVLWDAPRHIAIQGMTRSGKSSAVYSFLARAHATGLVRVVGIDPTSVMLRPFAALGEHHIHTGGADLAGGLDSVLDFAVREMDRRIGLLWPNRVDKIERFSRRRCVLLVVLEESAGLMAAMADDDAAEGRRPAERLAPRAKRLIRRILAEGAKVGVVALVIAQRMSTEVIPGDARSNVGYRLTLRMDDGDGLRMLHSGVQDEDARWVASAKPGRALVDSPALHHARVRLDWLDYDGYLAALGWRVRAGRPRPKPSPPKDRRTRTEDAEPKPRAASSSSPARSPG